MLEQILSEANLNRAWKQVRANQGAEGVEGITIDDFPAYIREHWPRVKQALLAGTYQPSPVKRVEIPKRSGVKRPLGIPTVLDRLIQQAILQVLQPIFDPTFKDCFPSKNSGARITTRNESPDAAPHVRWCGRGGRKARPDPLMLLVS